MSANEPALLDPFSVSAPDEAAELSALVRTLELAEGFQLIFVRCNQIPQRERLMEEVRSRLPKLNIQTIFFREPIQHLLHSIQEQLMTPLPDAVFVSGLEFSLPIAAEAHAAPLIANINAARNSLAELLPCPVVLWIPEYVLTAIAQGAPDFFSIRSSVYFFAVKSNEIINLTRNLYSEKFWEVSSLSQAEKQDRIAAIERLLSDYELLPEQQRNSQIQLALIGQLGALFHAQGEYGTALSYYEKTFELAEKLHDRLNQAISLHQIGMIHHERGDYATAMKNYRQSLIIAEAIDFRVGIVGALHQIGRVYELFGEYRLALEQYEKSLNLQEGLGDKASLAILQHQIGNIYYSLKEYKKALAQYTQSLKIAKESNNHAGEAMTLHQLGMIHEATGEIDFAKTKYEESLRIATELGDKSGMAITLHHLGRLHQELGEYETALTKYEQALKIFQEMGDRSGESSSRGQIGYFYTQLGYYQEALEQLYVALTTLLDIQSPKAQAIAKMLKTLRQKWGENNFEISWRHLTNTDVPTWLMGEKNEKE